MGGFGMEPELLPWKPPPSCFRLKRLRPRPFELFGSISPLAEREAQWIPTETFFAVPPRACSALRSVN